MPKPIIDLSPIASGPGFSLYKTDCLHMLPKMEADSIDAIITDPPYSSGGMFRGDRMAVTSSKYLNNRKDHAYGAEFLGDNKDQRAFTRWCFEWMSECYRVLKPGAPFVAFIDWRQLPTITDALQMAGFIWRGVAVWDKTEGVRPAKGRYRQQAEFLVWGSKGAMPPRKDAPAVPGVFRCAPLKGGKHHIAGKPELLMSNVVKIVTPGGTVFDPFMGSGTTGVACIRAGLQFIGTEMVQHYINISESRLKAAIEECPMLLPIDDNTPQQYSTPQQ
ncbi:MAG: site-specific DNA-methyltransferase [Candidatus Sedimenticola sp. (ex Thyasira tokunagai)]